MVSCRRGFLAMTLLLTAGLEVGCASPVPPSGVEKAPSLPVQDSSPPPEAEPQESTPTRDPLPTPPAEPTRDPLPTLPAEGRSPHPTYLPPGAPGGKRVPAEDLASCGLRPKEHPYKAQVETCCQGRYCNGQCGVLNLQGDIGCHCGSTLRGCPSGTVCCEMKGACVPSSECIYSPGAP